MQVQNFVVDLFDVTSATDAEWGAMLDLRQEISKANNPDDPASSRDVMRKGWETIPNNPYNHVHIYSVKATDSDNLIGLFIYAYPKESNPAYEENKHVAFFDLHLLEDYRRKGYGTQLFRELVQKLQNIAHITVVETNTNVPAGEKFAETFGGEIAIRSISNRLYLDSFDWQMMEDWFAETSAIAQANNVTMEHFEGVIHDADIEQYAKLYTEVMNQQPLEELEGTETIVTPDLMRQGHEEETSVGHIHITKITREADGTISGLTEIIYNPKNPHRVDQLLTGVQENYRGRKLGKWLKSAMMLHIRDTYPDVQFIATTNANSNAPMLAINSKLGFKLYKQNTAYKFKLEDLATKLGL